MAQGEQPASLTLLDVSASRGADADCTVDSAGRRLDATVSDGLDGRHDDAVTVDVVASFGRAVVMTCRCLSVCSLCHVGRSTL